MSSTRQAHAFLLTGYLLFACSSSDEKDLLLDEAARYHNEATKIQAVVEPKIEQIDSLKLAFLARRNFMDLATVATLDSLKTAFEVWEENVVEVPGMPHNHSHEHGKREHTHKHADATLKDLPADQMRDLQRELLNSIRQIQARLATVTKPRP